MSKKPHAEPPASTPFNSPFATLAAKRAELPTGESTQAVVPSAIKVKQGPARAVVRYERKGHGGKEMTRVEQLGLKPAELDTWLKEAKHALGCGGVIEGDALLLQGDQRQRLPGWLTKKSVRKITVS